MRTLKDQSQEKVLISGIGAISAAGAGIEQSLDTFANKVCNADQISKFRTDLTYPVFEVKTLPEEYSITGQPTLSLAMYAAQQASEAAGLPQELSELRVGVCLGTTVASQLNDISFYQTYRSFGSAEMTAVDRFLNGNLADAVAWHLNCQGPALTVVNACSSGTDAIGTALSWLRCGICDIVLAGGADEINRVPVSGFGALGIYSSEACKPFDRERAGLNLGEGAGVLVLERSDSARDRNVDSDLYLAGFGTHADAHHLTAPHPEGVGLTTAIERALQEGALSPGDISFVNAHGTATLDNDRVEARVISGILGREVPFHSTKGYTGHTLGAAGGLEAAFTAAFLRQGWIPANAGFSTQDETMPVAPVSEKTEVPSTHALSTSLAFGGHNSALVIGYKNT